MLPTKPQIEEFLALKQEKAELDRRGRALDKKLELLSADFSKAIATHAPVNRELKIGGHRMWLVEGHRYPSWKDAYVRDLGIDKAEAVIQATTPKTVLHVE